MKQGKQAEWEMEERWNGRKEVEHHKSGPWTIVIDPDTRGGFIKNRHRKTLVESLEPNRFLAKGVGIPDYVIDKVNELIAVPIPVIETKQDEMTIIGNEHISPPPTPEMLEQVKKLTKQGKDDVQ